MICRGEGKRSFRTSKRVCVRMRKSCKNCGGNKDGKKYHFSPACQTCVRGFATDNWRPEPFRPPMTEGYPEPACIGNTRCEHQNECGFAIRCGDRMEAKAKFFAEGGSQELWATGYRQFDFEGLFYRDHDSSPRCPRCGNTICSGWNPGHLCYDCTKLEEQKVKA